MSAPIEITSPPVSTTKYAGCIELSVPRSAATAELRIGSVTPAGVASRAARARPGFSRRSPRTPARSARDLSLPASRPANHWRPDRNRHVANLQRSELDAVSTPEEDLAHPGCPTPAVSVEVTYESQRRASFGEMPGARPRYRAPSTPTPFSRPRTTILLFTSLNGNVWTRSHPRR